MPRGPHSQPTAPPRFLLRWLRWQQSPSKLQRKRHNQRQLQTYRTLYSRTAPPSTTPPHVSRGGYLWPTAPPPRGSHSTAGRAKRLARVCTSGRGCTLAWALAGAAAPRSVGETCAWKRSGTQRTKAASAGMEALRQGEGAWSIRVVVCLSARRPLWSSAA